MAANFLTKEGYQKLQHELEHLKTVRRNEVAERLHQAIEEGNKLSEDPEYEAAKNEQAFIEGRIIELELLLASARIIEDGSRSVVQLGARVTIKETGTPAEVYTIVGEAEANPRAGKISHLSPLGKALLDHKAGDSVEVMAPSGPFKVKIQKVE